MAILWILKIDSFHNPYNNKTISGGHTNSKTTQI